MLKVSNMAVFYRDRSAVSNISFSLQPGQITGLLGPNGAGKSTLLKGMLGLIPTATGNATLDGQPLIQQLQRTAYVPQRSQIDWDYPISVEKVVMMGRIRQTGWFRSFSRYSQEVVSAAIERVGMTPYIHRQIGELSGGQQQRVFLARAIAQQADVFFFDEPFSGVDKQTEEIMYNVFSELKAAGKILLVISHDLGETLNCYDQLLLLNKELIAMGSAEEVMTVDNLKFAYGQKLHLMTA